MLTFEPNTKSLSDFLEDLKEYVERVFGDSAHQMMDSLLYPKTPPHLKDQLT